MNPPLHDLVVRRRICSVATDVRVRLVDGRHPATLGEVRTFPRWLEVGG
jgi:hypothetical protein